jgi:hypothetical protein
MLCHDDLIPEPDWENKQTALVGVIGDAVPECFTSLLRG